MAATGEVLVILPLVFGFRRQGRLACESPSPAMYGTWRLCWGSYFGPVCVSFNVHLLEVGFMARSWTRGLGGIRGRRWSLHVGYALLVIFVGYA